MWVSEHDLHKVAFECDHGDLEEGDRARVGARLYDQETMSM